MSKISRSAITLNTAKSMFDLVSSVNEYPSFLPWCKSVDYKEISENTIIANITAELKGIPIKFSTINTNIPHKEIHIRLNKGPFKSFNGLWVFTDLEKQKSKVEFVLEWNLKNFILEKTIGVIFDQIAKSIFDAFINRANEKFK
jgi:ribosome-associated toxin RatA of RatAB toxin-antitoxin module